MLVHARYEPDIHAHGQWMLVHALRVPRRSFKKTGLQAGSVFQNVGSVVWRFCSGIWCTATDAPPGVVGTHPLATTKVTLARNAEKFVILRKRLPVWGMNVNVPKRVKI